MNDDIKNKLETEAKNGNASACLELGHRYMHGDGVKKNRAMARKWFTAGAEIGDADCMYWAGYTTMHRKAATWEEPNPDPQPYFESALPFFQKSAALGNAKAMAMLGRFQFGESGDPLPQNLSNAIDWINVAMSRSVPEAFYYMAWLSVKGRGVSRDLLRAKECIDKAVQLGFKDKCAIENVTCQIYTAPDGEYFVAKEQGKSKTLDDTKA